MDENPLLATKAPRLPKRSLLAEKAVQQASGGQAGCLRDFSQSDAFPKEPFGLAVAILFDQISSGED
jgi:hypothetical protein